MILNKKFGNYRAGPFWLVPYRHHMHQASWKVLVSKLLRDNGDIKSEHFNVLAETAIEAAKEALLAWKKWEKEQKRIEDLENERKRELQNSGTEGKPPLDKLQCEADSKITIGISGGSLGNEKLPMRRVSQKG